MALQLATAAINVARSEHYELNPVTGLYERALLLEDGRTNTALHSESLSASALGSSAVSYSSDVSLAPDGTLSADKLVEDGANDLHFHRQDCSGVLAIGTPITFSRFLKAGERTTASLAFSNGIVARADYDLATGALTATSGAAFVRAGVIPIDDDWYRCWVTGLSNGTNVHRCHTYPNSAVAYAGDGASGIHCWGGMIEENAAFVSSYIPTTSAAVPRAADSLKFPFTLTKAVTAYVKFIERGNAIGSVVSAVLHVGASTSGTFPRMFLFWDGGAYYRAVWYSAAGTAQSSAVLGINPSIGDLVELRWSLAEDGVSTLEQSINGAVSTSATGAAATSALPAAWAGTELHLGRRGASNIGFAAFLAVKIARGTKSLAQMRALAPVS